MFVFRFLILRDSKYTIAYSCIVVKNSMQLICLNIAFMLILLTNIPRFDTMFAYLYGASQSQTT